MHYIASACAAILACLQLFVFAGNAAKQDEPKKQGVLVIEDGHAIYVEVRADDADRLVTNALADHPIRTAEQDERMMRFMDAWKASYSRRVHSKELQDKLSKPQGALAD